MEQESDRSQISSSSNSNNANASSSSSTGQVDNEQHDQRQDENEDGHSQHGRLSILSYRVNTLISELVSSSSEMRDDVWSCVIVLVTFCFFGSMTLILGLYGSANLQLGPNYSHLIQVGSIFVQSIKAQQVSESSLGPMLYGFHEQPPLDNEINWSETHNVSVQANYHKEWIYFLNKGSTVDISYSVENPNSSFLSLVIAQGSESLVEWIDDPSYPNTTLSWNIINGSGTMQQDIPKSSIYYIAVGNLNSYDVEVHLDININAVVYNTTTACYKCYLSSRLCSFKLTFFGANAAVLTSPGPEEGKPDDDWYVKVSYGPRWITYLAGSGVMIVLFLFGFSFCNSSQTNNGDRTRSRSAERGTEQDPLLSHKDDDLSSWGSSYDSVSHDEEDLDEWLAVQGPLDEKQQKDGEGNPPRGLCVICCDTPRDCFFLPCGHCAACFTCGSRIAEEAGSCPICRRKMKKVRKIFSV